jgi:hypothetical protein
VSDPVASRTLRGQAILSDPLVQELLAAPLVAVLATLDPSGIHAVAIWYAAYRHEVILASGSRSRKVRNLERDSRATLVLHDSRPGFEVCGASLRGRTEVVRLPEARELVDLVHRRYVDETAETDPDVAEFLESDDVALRFRPESAITWDERGSPASARLRELGGARPLLPTSPRR